MRRFKISVLFGLMFLVCVSFSTIAFSETPGKKAPASSLTAFLNTSKGMIRIKLFDQNVPYTVANFVNLAQRGFYNNLTFHRVIPDFMIQGGCPSGDGSGDPGYSFNDEFDSTLTHDKPGILSMANSGADTNGSQFFITHGPTPHLNGMHAVFGKVWGKEDMDVVNSIRQDDKIISIRIDGDTAPLLAKTKDKVDEWNKILDVKYPQK